MLRPNDTVGRAWFAPLAAITLTLPACQPDSLFPALDAHLCDQGYTPVHAVQGEGFKSPMLGQELTVRGIVNHRSETGFYIESASADESADTSEGLFIEASPVPGEAVPGTLLVARGRVAELGADRDTLTAITDLAGIRVCESQVRQPLTSRQLPMSDLQKEASEGMRIVFEQQLSVTDVYRMSRSEIMVSSGGMLPSPTEVAHPGDHAREQAWLNSQSGLAVRLPGVPQSAFPAGSSTARLLGVLGHDGRGLRLLLEEDLNAASPALPTIAVPEATDVRVVSLNLHNYFNGDGAGGGFLPDRGPVSLAEFEDQRRRLVAALRWIQPHVVAVVELENDGFGPNSANTDFLEDLEQATGGEWRAVDPGHEKIGTDRVRVGLFYRPDLVLPTGEAQVLETQTFDSHNRVPLAQTFLHRQSSIPFLLAVNHFKSKGRCPEEGPDADHRDGQSCWNRARVAAADAVTRWAHELAGVNADGRALLVGDFNAYRLEDPVRYIVDHGFVDLTAPAGLGHEYSYVYYGRSGTLDHAFASEPLRPLVWSAQIPHINAGYPPGLPLEPDWLRFSDHDPVVVDLRFRQSSTWP